VAFQNGPDRPGQSSLFLVAVLHATLLALPLFYAPVFTFDWINHLWYANYVAHHWAADGVLPMFANVTIGIGNPSFIFYGSGLYGTLAPVVLLFGPDLGMRVAVFAALLIPNLALAHIARRCLETPWTAGCVTIVISTSVYQLTNIYSRGATTEFFAYQFLLFGLVVLMDALLDAEGWAKSAKTVLGLASAAIGALSHPPTAYLAVLFLGIPALAFAVLQRDALGSYVRSPVRAFAVLLLLVVPLASWGGLAASFGSALELNRSEVNSQLHFFPQSIDHWLARLLPWPMDFRVEIEGFDLVSTPYLSAPVSLGACALLATLLVGQSDWLDRRPSANRWTLFVFIVAIVAAASLSLLASLPIGALEPSIASDGKEIVGVAHATPSSWRAQALGRVQFAYRLVNLTNLTLIVGSLAVMVLNNQRRWTGDTADLFGRERSRVVLIVAATVSTMTACMKVVEVSKEYWLLPKYSGRSLAGAGAAPMAEGMVRWVSPVVVRQMRDAVKITTQPPSTAYGLFDYAMPALFSPYEADGRFMTKRIAFEPRGGRAVAATSCEQPCALATNLVASPFFRLSLDGAAVSPIDIRKSSLFVVVLADAGNHRLQLELGTWATHLLAGSTMALVFLFWGTLAVLTVRSLMSNFRGPRSSPASVDLPNGEIRRSSADTARPKVAN
jgi:hypothetical protein